MKIGERVKAMIQRWLDIFPASQQTIVLQENLTRELEVLRAQLWYRGEATELHQFFKQLSSNSGGFWACAPGTNKVRKIHCGIPAIIVDTLAYIVKSDMNPIDVKRSEWEQITEEFDLVNTVGKSVVDTLVEGDGAYKISVDTDLSPYPIVEFVGASNVEYEMSRGIVAAIIFKTAYIVGRKRYMLHERYAKGSIESRLYDENGNEHPLDIIPQLAGIKPITTFDGDYIMAIPLKFYESKKHNGRGKSIFDGGKSDCFDALDEIISQWLDAIRAGRVEKYIPESLVPRNPENGSLSRVNSFGTEFIKIQTSLGDEKSSEMKVVQPDIKYEAFVSSYTHALLMCLQGLVSPATLGIDVGKMSSADAQREKKDVTGNTRNTITSALEKALPQLIEAILKTYDNMRELPPQDCGEITVSFGEYGAPDFDSRVETIGKASAYGIMSVKAQVEELWGTSKKDNWKEAEVKRILAEKGLVAGGDKSVGDELD